MRNTRFTICKVLCLATTLIVARDGNAAPPMVMPADADYSASGFVAPAGMPPVGSTAFNQTMQVPYMMAHNAGGGVMPVGHMQPPMQPPMQQASFLDSQRGCDCLGYGCNRCSGGPVGSGGILGGHPGGGCDSYSGHGLYGDHCGYGCGGCGPLGGGCGPFGCIFGRYGLLDHCGIAPGSLRACLSNLLPYSDAGQCAQRWYDISAEALMLTRNGRGGSGGLISTEGIDGDPALSLGDVGLGDITGGVRISGALIFGAGGNIETTYMGGHRWTGSGAATSADPGTLYSFISEFGTLPFNGLDDSDRSIRQEIRGESHFHSVDLNYRRRTMGPYCTVQGSWLVGLRYIRLDEALTFTADGVPNNTVAGNLPRFLDLTTSTKNDLFGAQIGGDVWWNIVPGVNFGTEVKLALMDNRVRREMFAFGNSLGPGATEGTRSGSFARNRTVGMLELNTTLIYRLSHSWALRGSHHLMAFNRISGGLDREASVALLQDGQIPAGQSRTINFGSMVLQGFSVGAEYVW